jgi:hypothetical protein
LIYLTIQTKQGVTEQKELDIASLFILTIGNLLFFFFLFKID